MRIQDFSSRLLHLDTPFQDQPVIEYDLEAKLVGSTRKLFLDLSLLQTRIDTISLIRWPHPDHSWRQPSHVFAFSSVHRCYLTSHIYFCYGNLCIRSLWFAVLHPFKCFFIISSEISRALKNITGWEQALGSPVSAANEQTAIASMHWLFLSILHNFLRPQAVGKMTRILLVKICPIHKSGKFHANMFCLNLIEDQIKLFF